MIKTVLFFFFLNFFSLNLVAQDISGSWVLDSIPPVKLYTHLKDQSPISSTAKRSVSIDIGKKNNRIKGKAKIEFDYGTDVSIIKGKVNHSNRTLTLFASNKFTNSRGTVGNFIPANERIYNWKYFRNDSTEFLLCESQDNYPNMFLNRYMLFKRAANKKLIPELASVITLSIPDSNTLKKRTDEIFKTILAETDTVNVAVYDNAEIDGDSVSIFLNNSLVAKHVFLSSEAKNFSIILDKKMPENKLQFFAENLGAIPPNTAFIIITVGNQTHRLNIKSDEKYNGTVIFMFNKKE